MDEKKLYKYRARVVNVVDGDTLDAVIDLGFLVSVRERFRLMRINAWETKGEEKEKGLLAKAFLQSTIEKVKGEILLESMGKDKYGRWLAEIWFIEPDTGDIKNINDLLVVSGHARYQVY